jgi:hypothetical protein
MEVMRVAAGDSTFQVKINELGVEKMRIPQFGPVSTDSLVGSGLTGAWCQNVIV